MPTPRTTCARLALVAALVVAVRLPAAHAAMFLVTTTADDGVGSLRQAIVAANALPGADTIAFAIPSPGIPRITPASQLPALTDPVTVDGTTQIPGGSVELDGSATAFAVGLTIAGGSSTVRGLVINGFGSANLLLTGPGNNVVEGNRIGTDTSGTQALSPLASGIEVSGSPANTIGGTAASSANLVSGNLFGIFVHGGAATGNLIEGNLIGTDASGTAAVANSVGIWIYAVSATVVGGVDPGTGNVVAGNDTDGIDITGSGATGTVLSGNAIGFAANLSTPVGNQHDGVYVSGGTDSLIGGGSPNWIGNNGGAGIHVASGVRNAIRGNLIAGNGGLGIDLDPAGVTPNDPGDIDTGANDLQNFPVLDPAFTGGSKVSGTLDSTPGASFEVEVFSSSTCDPTGYGEGAELLATLTVPTNGSGHADFTAVLARAVDASSEYLTATATDASGNTSEFSACTPATLLPTTTSTVSSSTTTTTAAATTSTTAATSTTTTTTDTSSTSTTTSDPATSTTSSTGAASTTTSTTSVSTTSTTGATDTTTTTAEQPSTTTTVSAPSTTTTTDAGPSTTTSLPVSSTTSTTVVPATTTTTSPPASTTSTTGVPATTTTTTAGQTTSTTTASAPSTTTTTTAPGSSTTSTTTTAPGVTTTTTAPPPVTTTTTPTLPPTTSTTLPGPCSGPACGCLVEVTFASIRCRLGELHDASGQMAEPPAVRTRIGRQLGRAQLVLGRAETRCAAARRRAARRFLLRVGGVLRRVLRTVRSRAPRPAAIDSFVGTTALLLGDTRTLTRGLVCR